MGVAGALPANTASFYQLQDALGYDAMTYTRYYDFMVMIDPGFKDLVAALEIDKLASKPWNPRTRLFDEWILGLLASKDEGFLPFLRQANYWNSLVRTIHNRRLLDLMNVKYLVSPPGWFPDATLQNLELVYDKEMRIYLNASSVKFVGGFRLRELAERVVESQFGDAKRSKSIGFSHAHSPIEKPRSILLRFAAVTG